jgi:hypothetical protein
MTPGNVTSPITLTSGQLLINKSLTITGPGAGLLAVSGNNANRVFNVDPGTVTISGLTITQGLADASTVPANFGGGFFNKGNLTLNDCVVSGNNASIGGGIFNFTEADLERQPQHDLRQHSDWGGRRRRDFQFQRRHVDSDEQYHQRQHG